MSYVPLPAARKADLPTTDHSGENGFPVLEEKKYVLSKNRALTVPFFFNLKANYVYTRIRGILHTFIENNGNEGQDD